MPLKPSNLTLQRMSQGEAYNNFASSIRSHSTLKTYRYRLAQYAERIRKTADLDQIIADDLLNPKQAEKYIKQFIASMKQHGMMHGPGMMMGH